MRRATPQPLLSQAVAVVAATISMAGLVAEFLLNRPVVDREARVPLALQQAMLDSPMAANPCKEAIPMNVAEAAVALAILGAEQALHRALEEKAAVVQATSKAVSGSCLPETTQRRPT